ncbi:carbonic anhydrase [Penicillium macrosclerotiorum]|uniref:carbonic anhydrase n=1 Tax=Penicillium macrosclerotiorum TaxID=303699 RepID=UPI002546A5FE|nr:carbonic anhydrase [Penicillium macrosclerotiorum]KAJ5689636.1 carbonic anhydrase [Penicillium macrosclerotiorum]
MQLPPDFIPSSKQPMQQVLWIGCSDSCFQETTILDLLPDEMLVHRNLGNMLIEGDMSSELTVKHAITCLKVNISKPLFKMIILTNQQVKHIVVCGHYGCGIVKAESRDGLNGPWLSKLDALHSQFKGTIDTLPSDERNQAFVELNVLDQLRSLRQFPEVSKAASEGNLQLHGIVYNLKSGKAQRLIEN